VNEQLTSEVRATFVLLGLMALVMGVPTVLGLLAMRFLG
jgi:hypothetical protein